MFNLNEKYFSISERCGRNHQNKFCLRPPKRRLCTWELNQITWYLWVLMSVVLRSSVWWWRRSIQLFLTAALQDFFTSSSTKRYLISWIPEIETDWWWILWYKKIEPILWEFGFEIFAQNLKLRGLCLYVWVFYTQKNWNFGVNSGTLNFISGFRHQKCRNELEGGSTVIFKMRSALRCRLRAWLLKIIFTIFSIKLNNKKPVFWY